MTPQEIANMQAGLDPRAYYPDYDIARRVRAGELPEELLGRRGATTIPPGSTGTSNFLQRFLNSQFGKNATQTGAQAKEAGMKAVSAAVRNPGRLGGLGATAILAGTNALQGDPLGAATSAAGGLAGAGLAGGVARMLPGPAGKVAQVALPAVGALLGGSAAQAVGQRVAAQVPGTPEVAQRSQEERQREFQREQNRLDYQSMSQAEFAQNKELLGYLMTQSVEQAKAMLPIQKDMLRQQLVNQQALNASNATLYQQMGRTATIGRAALANIAETGATTRALISNNPYAGSVLQAPSISFG